MYLLGLQQKRDLVLSFPEETFSRAATLGERALQLLRGKYNKTLRIVLRHQVGRKILKNSKGLAGHLRSRLQEEPMVWAFNHFPKRMLY